jgi:Phage terminase, small subunit
MGEVMTKDQIVAALVERGESKARSVMYADAFVENHEASANIAEHGIIVSHPRTANPIENPYLAIRDRAAKKLDGMRKVKADFLW